MKILGRLLLDLHPSYKLSCCYSRLIHCSVIVNVISKRGGLSSWLMSPVNVNQNLKSMCGWCLDWQLMVKNKIFILNKWVNHTLFSLWNTISFPFSDPSFSFPSTIQTRPMLKLFSSLVFNLIEYNTYIRCKGDVFMLRNL